MGESLFFSLNMHYNQKVGNFGEKIACDYLIRHGYQILERNVKISYREVDIIANFKGKIVFIEVKTRTSVAFGRADEAIGHKKIKNLKKALGTYVNKYRHNPEKVGIDLISIDINKIKKTANIKHYKDIF